MIYKYDSFNIISNLKNEFEKVFKYCQIRGNYILCSDELDRGGNPNVRIDIKKPNKSLKLKVEENTITFISILNSTKQVRFFSEIMSILSKMITIGSTIIVDSDVSGGFWNHISNKYPDYEWIFK